MLRTPAIDGWAGDERGVDGARRVQLALTRLEGGALGLTPPGERNPVKLSERVVALLDEPDAVVTIGWPHALAIVRCGGCVRYAEGDPLHFGAFALEPGRSVWRTGFEYLSEQGAEVRVEVTIADGGEQRAVMLGPGESAMVGPYRLTNDHSYDPADRPSGARHAGYFMRLERAPGAASPGLRADVPDPLDVDRPEQLLALARAAGVLDGDEAYLAEPKVLAARLAAFEGPHAKLDELMRAFGPHPATFRRLGEAVEARSAGVARGGRGDARVSRVTVRLEPTRELSAAREDGGAAPGRLRRAPTGR